jgi:hypothetical protein
MSAYENFIQDFPKRCRTLLATYEGDAKQKDLEITLLTAIATSAFIIPYERLKPGSKEHIADDRHVEAVHKLEELLKRNFIEWQTGHSWEIVEGLEGQQIRTSDVDEWASREKRRHIQANIHVETIIDIIRNALAHGNIFIHPPKTSGRPAPQIQSIILASKPQREDIYKVVIVSTSDFRRLILDWVSFLESLRLPTKIV